MQLAVTGSQILTYSMHSCFFALLNCKHSRCLLPGTVISLWKRTALRTKKVVLVSNHPYPGLPSQIKFSDCFPNSSSLHRHCPVRECSYIKEWLWYIGLLYTLVWHDRWSPAAHRLHRCSGMLTSRSRLCWRINLGISGATLCALSCKKLPIIHRYATNAMLTVTREQTANFIQWYQGPCSCLQEAKHLMCSNALTVKECRPLSTT